MKENIDLYIKSEQFYGHDNSEIIKYKTKGVIYQKRNKYYLIYNDQNCDGARTRIKIIPEEERVYVNRTSPRLKQLFEYNCKTKGEYITPYGEFDIEIYTSLLEIDLRKARFKVKYKLFLNGKYTSQNYLSISWDIL